MQQQMMTTFTPEQLSTLVQRLVDEAVEAKGAKEWYTAEEAATYVSLSVDTLYNARLLGEIPYSKIGRSVRIRRQDLDTWMESRKKRNKRIG